MTTPDAGPTAKCTPRGETSVSSVGCSPDCTSSQTSKHPKEQLLQQPAARNAASKVGCRPKPWRSLPVSRHPKESGTTAPSPARKASRGSKARKKALPCRSSPGQQVNGPLLSDRPGTQSVATLGGSADLGKKSRQQTPQATDGLLCVRVDRFPRPRPSPLATR